MIWSASSQLKHKIESDYIISYNSREVDWTKKIGGIEILSEVFLHKHMVPMRFLILFHSHECQ